MDINNDIIKNLNIDKEVSGELCKSIFRIFCITSSPEEDSYLIQDAGEVDSKLEKIKICINKDRLPDLKNLIKEALPSRDHESILSLIAEDTRPHDEVQESIKLLLSILLNNNTPVDILIKSTGGVEELLNYVNKNTKTPNIETEDKLRELNSKILELTDSVNNKIKSIENLKIEISSKEEQIQKLNSELNQSKELISSLELKNKNTPNIEVSDDDLEEFLGILDNESDIFVANGIKDYLSNLLDEDNEELVSIVVFGLLNAYRNLKGSAN